MENRVYLLSGLYNIGNIHKINKALDKLYLRDNSIINNCKKGWNKNKKNFGFKKRK